MSQLRQVPRAPAVATALLYRVEADGNEIRTERVPMGALAFVLTERHRVFFLTPVEFDVLGAPSP